MFCPNCGNEVKNGDLFCDKCGARIEPEQENKEKFENVNTQSNVQSIRKDTRESKFSSKARRIITVQIVILVAFLGAFYYFGKRNASPQAVANQFVKDYNAHRWSKIYNTYKFNEGTFINKECFKKTMNQSNVQMLSTAVGLNVIDGQYVCQITKGSDVIYLHIAKSTKKSFLFFDRYEIVEVLDSDMMTDEIKIPNFSGITAKIDGVEVKKTNQDTDDTISAEVFKGAHKVTFSGADGLFEKNEYTINTKTSNLLDQMKYSNQAAMDAASALRGYMPAISEVAIKDSEKSSLASYFISVDAAQAYGGDLCGYASASGSDTKNLGEVQLTKCEKEDSDSSDDLDITDGIAIRVEGSRSYQTESWSGDTENQTMEIRGTAYMIKKDGKWVIYGAKSY